MGYTERFTSDHPRLMPDHFGYHCKPLVTISSAAAGRSAATTWDYYLGLLLGTTARTTTATTATTACSSICASCRSLMGC